MSAFEELERQLSESVAARRRVRRAVTLGGLGRWWRERVGVGALALAAVVFAVLLASGTHRSTGAAGSAPEGVLSAEVTEAPCPPCQAVGGRLHGPLSGKQVEAGEARAARPVREVLVRRGIPTVVWSSDTRGLR